MEAKNSTRASATGRNGGKKTAAAATTTTLQLDGAAGRSRRGDAYDRLVSAIIFCDVEPGAVVDEKTLARDLGLGLGPVRDALQRLSLEGMVERHPRIGTRIPDLTVRDLQDVFEARVMVEGHAAAAAAQRATASDIAEMRASLADVFEVVARRDYRSLLQQDRRFHGALAAASGNRMLERLSHQLLNISSRFWFSGLPRMELDALQADMKAHLAVIDAIERRDVAGAESAMRKVLGRFPGAMSLFFSRMPA